MSSVVSDIICDIILSIAKKSYGPICTHLNKPCVEYALTTVSLGTTLEDVPYFFYLHFLLTFISLVDSDIIIISCQNI